MVNDDSTYCKNCLAEIQSSNDFCSACGARVVKERISVKNLFSSLVVVLGWDQAFFITLRHLLFRPKLVLANYINGTRKKYTNPFSFLVFFTAFSLLIFNQFVDEFVKMSSQINFQNNETVIDITSEEEQSNNAFQILGFENEREYYRAVATFQLKYGNLVTFLMLPLLSLISFWVFGKPYNFGEHLVINSYLQGVTSALGILLFVISMMFELNLFLTGSIALAFCYYCYAYAKLYQLNFGQLAVKIIAFIGIILAIQIVLFLMGFLVAVLLAR